MSTDSDQPWPKLVIVTDVRVAGPELLLRRIAAVAKAARAGTVLVQLRDREVSVRERLALGRELRALAREHRQSFGVNDRADVAVLLEADWLHLGERSIRPADARAIVGPQARISRACHDPTLAAADGADAVVLSPILATRKGNPALGAEALGVARRAGAAEGGGAPRLYALGGIDERGARRCIDAGADGVAVIGAVVGRDDATPLLDALGIR